LHGARNVRGLPVRPVDSTITQSEQESTQENLGVYQ